METKKMLEKIAGDFLDPGIWWEGKTRRYETYRRANPIDSATVRVWGGNFPLHILLGLAVGLIEVSHYDAGQATPPGWELSPNPLIKTMFGGGSQWLSPNHVQTWLKLTTRGVSYVQAIHDRLPWKVQRFPEPDLDAIPVVA